MAPFKWAGFLESLFKFMSTRIWRPVFVIVVCCNMVYWYFEDLPWYYWVNDIAGFVALAIGVFELIIDIGAAL